ncbi:MAG: hypothetical protein GSR83_04320 [Desulfurococcales archaeon]|nr:hypothetical protein [Desulfurococcales archaeon]
MVEEMRKTGLLLLLLIITPALASLAYIPANAQPSGSNLNVYLKGDNLTVTNRYYEITFNLSLGARITSWVLNEGNSQVNLVEAGPVSPTLSIDFYTTKYVKTTSVTYNNRTVNITSTALMLGKWNARIIENSSDSAIILFYPISMDALKQIEPLNLSMITYFYSDKPYIDVYYVISNPSNAPVYPKKLVGDSSFILKLTVFNAKEKIDDWNGTILYTSFENYKSVFRHDIKPAFVQLLHRENLLSAGLFNNNTREVSLISPLKGSPSFMDIKTFDVPGSMKGVEYEVGYPIEKIAPGSSSEIGIRVVYGLVSPCTVESMNIQPLYKTMDPKDFAVYEAYKDDFPAKIVQLNNTVKGLREARDNLLKEIDELNNKVEYWKGNATYWKTEYTIVKEQIKSYSADARRASVISVIGAVLGLIIGFAGGAVFYRKRY